MSIATLDLRRRLRGADAEQKVTPSDTVRLRADLNQLKARYDSGAVSRAIFTVIRNIENELAWAEHRGQP
jgi:hypothetical protein